MLSKSTALNLSDPAPYKPAWWSKESPDVMELEDICLRNNHPQIVVGGLSAGHRAVLIGGLSSPFFLR